MFTFLQIHFNICICIFAEFLCSIATNIICCMKWYTTLKEFSLHSPYALLTPTLIFHCFHIFQQHRSFSWNFKFNAFLLLSDVRMLHLNLIYTSTLNRRLSSQFLTFVYQIFSEVFKLNFNISDAISYVFSWIWPCSEWNIKVFTGLFEYSTRCVRKQTGKWDGW